MGPDRPATTLTSPFALTADAFADGLRKALPKKRKLTAAEIGAIRQAHADTIAPITTKLREAERLERELSAIVNAAYGLTPEEEALIWRTAPPPMPVTPARFPHNPARSRPVVLPRVYDGANTPVPAR